MRRSLDVLGGVGVVVTLVLLFHQTAFAAGARLFKSGPIQITADGRWVWVANKDADSVSRIDADDGSVLEVVLPDADASDSPRGLSVAEDGSEVWVACHDSDRLYVLRGADGAVLAQVDLPWGSGP
jgi:DNA-binding beta-propeller fold protein YncE